MVSDSENLTPETAPIKLSVRDLTIGYEGKPILSDVNLEVKENEIFGIIGPAGAGKTSFLKCLNRMDIYCARPCLRPFYRSWCI